MAESKSSSIKTPFSDAVVKKDTKAPSGKDTAKQPAHPPKSAELYHR